MTGNQKEISAGTQEDRMLGSMKVGREGMQEGR
jgi:hypothetical protein